MVAEQCQSRTPRPLLSTRASSSVKRGTSTLLSDLQSIEVPVAPEFATVAPRTVRDAASLTVIVSPEVAVIVAPAP